MYFLLSYTLITCLFYTYLAFSSNTYTWYIVLCCTSCCHVFFCFQQCTDMSLFYVNEIDVRITVLYNHKLCISGMPIKSLVKRSVRSRRMAPCTKACIACQEINSKVKTVQAIITGGKYNSDIDCQEKIPNGIWLSGKNS